MDSSPPNFRQKSEKPTEVVVYPGGRGMASWEEWAWFGVIVGPVVLIGCLVLWDGFTSVLRSVGVLERKVEPEPVRVIEKRPVPRPISPVPPPVP